MPWRLAGWSVLLVVGLALVIIFVYSGKGLPGVAVNGAKIAGLDRNSAIAAVQQHVDEFSGSLIPVNYAGTSLQLSPSKLDVKYDVAAAVDQGLQVGRRGSTWKQAKDYILALLGRSTNVSNVEFSDDALTPFVQQIDSSTFSAVSDASLNFSGNSVTVTADNPGKRLDIGSFVMQVKNRLESASLEAIDAPVSDVAPSIDAPSLQSAKAQASTYVSGPLKLDTPTETITVSQDQIVSWIKLSRPNSKTFETSHNIADYYAGPAEVKMSLNDAAVTKYVAGLAAKIDQAGKNALLAMQNNQLIVVQPSRPGQSLDQLATVASIKTALTKSAYDRELTLAVKVTQPDVTENNLASLGIKELISEGISYFPHSTADRITNITVGSNKYSQIIIKPNEIFSFNEYLGNVDAANGFRPGLAIVGNKIQPEYGGGLCQVSSTVYRAALLAGLPIVERVNHAYALAYYIAPFGVPGVDATIYSPQVDLKFKNDTGSYILVQPVVDIANATLKFDFYGTKTKVGVIRGPSYISGNSDVTKPSTTVFYRDVQDLSGKVLKTDTVTTRYASSLDFTEVKLPGFN